MAACIRYACVSVTPVSERGPYMYCPPQSCMAYIWGPGWSLAGQMAWLSQHPPGKLLERVFSPFFFTFSHSCLFPFFLSSFPSLSTYLISHPKHSSIRFYSHSVSVVTIVVWQTGKFNRNHLNSLSLSLMKLRILSRKIPKCAEQEGNHTLFLSNVENILGDNSGENHKHFKFKGALCNFL